MKRMSLMALVGLALIGGAGSASAASFGVYVGNDHPYYRHHRHWRDYYAYQPGCRIVITHRYNRYGDRITVRKRICD
ncbi:MAG TPA: hypothetical protein VFA57_13495 [Pseudolabrys sp.]|nr:hypothetical protein [Pseudolabrys sp.]